MLGLLDGVEEVLLLVDSVNINHEHPGEHKVPVEMLQSLQPHNPPLTLLKLKLGCPLIVLPNMSTKCSLCNGIRVMLISI
jgi:hypothetical protein